MLDLPRRLTGAPYDERVTASEAGFGSVLLGPVEQQTGRLRPRVQSLLTILLVSTNLVGAVIVFVLSAFVLPGPPPNHPVTLALAIGADCPLRWQALGADSRPDGRLTWSTLANPSSRNYGLWGSSASDVWMAGQDAMPAARR